MNLGLKTGNELFDHWFGSHLFPGVGTYHAGCPSRVTVSWNMALPHLKLNKDKGCFQCWGKNRQHWAYGEADFMGNLTGI